MLIGTEEAYTLWAPEYDTTPNPVLALEMRTLGGLMGPLAGRTVLDAGCGTGRWMRHAKEAGASVFGIDRSAAMLARAAGNVVRGDVLRLPFADNAVDLAICSMTLGYLDSATDAIRELLRVARCVIVSDFSPSATAAGWTRSFRAAGQRYEIRHHSHDLGQLEIDGATLAWSTEVSFGDQERYLFEAAGKADVFEASQDIPVLCAACWSRA
jgi:malonyl-CoA O-methyltransferase